MTLALEDVILRKLTAALAPTDLALTNDSHKHRGHAGAGEGSHWSVRIVSAAFAGKTAVARHKMVYSALADEMQGPIHALAIEARTPDE